MMYPDSHCSQSPTGAHHSYEVMYSIWRCRYCWAVKWQPRSWEDALKFGNAIRHFGIQTAYARALSRRPKIKEQLIRMEKIRLLRGTVPEKELIEMVVAIMISPIKKEVRYG